MTTHLFDPEPFGDTSRKPRTPRTTTSPQLVATVVVSGEHWNGTSSTTPGIVHYVIGQKVVRKRGTDISAIVSMCGLVVVPHTYHPDEQLPGCARCAARVR